MWDTLVQLLGQEDALGEGIGYPLQNSWASQVAQMVKNLPPMWETWVRSLGWEYPLEKEQLPTPVFWPGEFHGQRSLAGYSPWNYKESDMTEQLSKKKKKACITLKDFKSGQNKKFLKIVVISPSLSVLNVDLRF